MILGMSAGEVALMTAVLLIGGAITGYLAGLFGIGGGGVLVPILYEAFSALGVEESVLMHLVLGTSFAVMVPTAYRSYRKHLATGAVDTGLLRRLGPWVVLGVLLGSVLASGGKRGRAQVGVDRVRESSLASRWRSDAMTGGLGKELPQGWGLEAAAFAIGLVSTLMSIGGGMFFVALLTLYGRPILNAVATSAGFGPMIALPGVIGYIWAGWNAPDLPPLALGYVHVLAAAIVIPASVLAAPYGVAAAHRISKRKLELAFAAFLAVVALRLFISLVA